MRRSVRISLGVAGAAVLSGTAFAASTIFGGTATLRAGYGSNPRLATSVSENSGLFGGTLDARLTRSTGTGTTTLAGNADITETSNKYGRSENYFGSLTHSEQFGSRLAISGDVSLLDTVNPQANFSTDAQSLVPVPDILTFGSHTRQVNAAVNGSYQLSVKDLVQFGGNFSHYAYLSGSGSDYDQYGASLGYLRTINDRTRVGLQFSAMKVASNQYPDSSSYSAGVQLTQKIGRNWSFDGGVSAVVQKSSFFQQGIGFERGTYTTYGFNGTLCHNGARLQVCGLANRNSAPSGIGGLRTETQAGMRLNYQLTEHSSVNLEGIYDISKVRTVALPTQHYIETGGNYRRDLSQRLSVGFSGRYQRSTGFAIIGNEAGNHITSYSGTADVVYHFGRTG